MNSKPTSSRATASLLQRLRRPRPSQVLLRLLPAHLAHDAVGKRELRVRARADAEIVAESPVVEVVRARAPRLRVRRDLVVRVAGAGEVASTASACPRRGRRRAAPADGDGTACSTRRTCRAFASPWNCRRARPPALSPALNSGFPLVTATAAHARIGRQRLGQRTRRARPARRGRLSRARRRSRSRGPSRRSPRRYARSSLP